MVNKVHNGDAVDDSKKDGKTGKQRDRILIFSN